MHIFPLDRHSGESRNPVICTHKPVLLDLIDRIIVLAPGGIVMDGPRDTVIGQLRRNTPPQVVRGAGTNPATAATATGMAA